MGVPIGPLCAVYRETAGNYDTPTWSEVTAINELSPNRKWEMQAAKTRRTRTNEYAKTRLEAGVPGTILVDPDDEHYIAFADAADGDYPLDLLILNGKNDEEGAR